MASFMDAAIVAFSGIFQSAVTFQTLYVDMLLE
jgi:hypothetical protein